MQSLCRNNALVSVTLHTKDTEGSTGAGSHLCKLNMVSDLTLHIYVGRGS